MHVYFRYLAVVAGLCVEADFIFVPEDPPDANWPSVLCALLSQVISKSFFFFLMLFISLLF